MVTWAQLGSLALQMDCVGSATAGLAAELTAHVQHNVPMLAWLAWEGSLLAVVVDGHVQQRSWPLLEVVNLHSSLNVSVLLQWQDQGVE